MKARAALMRAVLTRATLRQATPIAPAQTRAVLMGAALIRTNHTALIHAAP